MRVRAAFWVAIALPGFMWARDVQAQSTRPSDSAPALLPPVEPIPSPITDRLAVRGTFFDPKVTTDLRLDPHGGAGLGTPFSAEQQLGLNSKPLEGRVEVIFRLEQRSRLLVDFFQLNRSAETTLGEPLVFGDNLFPAGTPIQSSLNWAMFGLTYTYSFIRNNRFELGAGLGLHLIQAQIMASEPATPLRTDETGVGAVPTVAVDGTWRISKRFAATLRGQYFGASISHVKGSFGDYHGDLQFRAFPNLALGLGYSSFNASLENETGSDSLLGQFHLRMSGPEAFVRVSF
jgi:hypothetical protein